VCLFGKVLRNEVDEEFRWVQQALKETVNGLIRNIVREKHTMKGEVELKAIIEELISDRTHLENSQWMKIIERMYDQDDI
jgi:hypothetical protein